MEGAMGAIFRMEFWMMAYRLDLFSASVIADSTDFDTEAGRASIRDCALNARYFSSITSFVSEHPAENLPVRTPF